MKLSQILTQTTINSGVYFIQSEIDVNEIKRVLEKENRRLFHFDGNNIVTSQDFFNVAKEIMSFPYLGDNWNALLDCMRDMSWHPANGYILIYDDFQVFARNNPKDFQIALEVMKDATESWRIDRHNKPFMYILLRGDKQFASEIQVLDEE